jgi:hypothetical protein
MLTFVDWLFAAALSLSLSSETCKAEKAIQLTLVIVLLREQSKCVEGGDLLVVGGGIVDGDGRRKEGV